MPVWGVVNQKGGVGKTTTAVNLAAGLARRGHRTLVIDCDPQGNATSGLGVDKASIEADLYDVLASVASYVDIPSPTNSSSTLGLQNAIVNVRENLDVVPATLDLAGAEPLLLNAVGKELILRDAIEPVRDQYEWIIVDAPPSLGLLTINVLAACDSILVPMQCEFFALEGLSQLMRTVEVVRKRVNPSLQIAKVLLTLHDPRNKLTQQVAAEVEQFFNGKVSRVQIPRNVRLSEAPSFGEPAVSLYPSSKGATSYMQFVDEVIASCAAA